MIDALERLAEADPAAELDPAPPEELLAQLIALPRRRPRQNGGRRIAVAGATAVAIATVIVALLYVTGRDPGLDPAARAYAQTSTNGDRILHVVATATSIVTDSSGTHVRETMRLEEWHGGAQTHHLEQYRSPDGQTAALDHLIGGDGVMQQRDGSGRYRVIQPSDNADAASVIGQQRAGFIEDFRARYAHGQLDDAGNASFAGRPARRYVVSATTQPGPPGMRPTQAYYVDRDTGAPLGYTSTLPFAMPGPAGGVPRHGKTTFVETVQTLEWLPSTPENLAKLSTFVLPSR